MTKVPLRQPELWSASVHTETRADGSVMIWQTEALPEYPQRLSDRIEHWATNTPDQPWMGERNPDGAWVTVSYAGLLQQIQSVGQYLLDLGLSVERPLLILSGNSIAHAVMALGAQYAGIPSAAIAPAYSQIPGGYGRLKSIAEQITPGAVFVDYPAPFAAAIGAVFTDLPLLAISGDKLTADYTTIVATQVSPQVAAANAATGAETIAKFLFTSGTTGSPKAVIQTQRMMCSNMEMVADCFGFLRQEPPVLLDWAPWNHVASGSKVFNMAIYNGGTYFIDGGKPTAALIQQTLRNIRDVSPTWYFNVPTGYDMLIAAMRQDESLARCFFKDLQLMMYAGAAMAEHTWAGLDDLAVKTTGEKILLCTGLGATETAPFAMFCTEPQDVPGNIGIPAKGLTLKLVPHDGKYEARLKGPSITPGYWRNEKLTSEAYDHDGYYCLGDALRFADPEDAGRGFFYDGRMAENFKMATGTWVAVGALRSKLTDVLQGIARDVVVAGEGRNELGILIVPSRPVIERLVENSESLSDAELFAHQQLRSQLESLLQRYNKAAGGASLRVGRAIVLTEPLSLDAGEITDKGSVNQRVVLRTHAGLVESLYTVNDRALSL